MSLKKLLIIGLLAVTIASGTLEAETLTLATGEWQPFTSKKMEGYGFITEIVTAVLTEMGVEGKYVFYPWRRCYSSVKKGSVWAAFPYSYTEERAKEIQYSDPVGLSKTLFFYHKRTSPPKYNSLADLKPYHVGGVLGYFYEAAFKKAGLKIDYANSEELALKALAAGKLDFMPFNELVGWGLIKKHYPTRIHEFAFIKKPYSVAELMLITSKTNQKGLALLERFNQSLKAIKSKPVYHNILKKYGIQE